MNEVTLMRCVLAFLIVFMHAFTCYNHSWREPMGFVEIPLYKWLSRISFAFTLEAFVFISGYLFAFQRISLKRKNKLIFLILNKLKRLILPSVIFSAAYFAIFQQYNSIGDLLVNLITGCGHLWFLPMLFWCFIGGWLMEQSKVNDGWKMLFLIILNLFMIFLLPLEFSRACSFMVYFYGGFIAYKYSDKIKKTISLSLLIRGWLFFVVVFALFRPLRDVLVCSDDASKLYKYAMLVGNNACQLLYASVGTLIFYFSAVCYTQQNELKSFISKLATCCFGIYIFQQFVLQILYYKTSFPLMVSPYWLPWYGFVIAIIVSFTLTILLLKTKLGRYLIG